jgi:hypothetical protein
MTTSIPTILNGLPIHWQGVDDTTPPGCTLLITEVVGLPTAYVLRAGEVIGRVETSRNDFHGYVGGGLKGGRYVGRGDFTKLTETIAAS